MPPDRWSLWRNSRCSRVGGQRSGTRHSPHPGTLPVGASRTAPARSQTRTVSVTSSPPSTVAANPGVRAAARAFPSASHDVVFGSALRKSSTHAAPYRSGWRARKVMTPCFRRPCACGRSIAGSITGSRTTSASSRAICSGIRSRSFGASAASRATMRGAAASMRPSAARKAPHATSCGVAPSRWRSTCSTSASDGCGGCDGGGASAAACGAVAARSAASVAAASAPRRGRTRTMRGAAQSPFPARAAVRTANADRRGSRGDARGVRALPVGNGGRRASRSGEWDRDLGDRRTGPRGRGRVTGLPPLAESTVRPRRIRPRRRCGLTPHGPLGGRLSGRTGRLAGRRAGLRAHRG